MQKILKEQNKFKKEGEMGKSINNFLEYLKHKKFSTGVIHKYIVHLKRYKFFCISNNFNDFLAETAFSNFFKSIKNSSKYSFRYSFMVLNKYRDYSLLGFFKIPYNNKYLCLKSDEFNNCLNDFNSSLQVSEIRASTKINQYNTIRKFLFFLESKKIMSFNNLSYDVALEFINKSKIANSTKSNYSKILKKFLNFTYSNNITSFSGNELFPKIRSNPRDRIPSFYQQSEISSLISAIDSNKENGKRNYAIILLASVLGFRASDIVNLKISDIDWNNKIIKIKQQKTEIDLIQPFPDEILFAILDYIKNDRPKTDCTNIFLTSKAPVRKLSVSLLSGIANKYFTLANIDTSKRKHGIHSLRHSLANNMLHNKISLQDISATLGHSYISTTTLYTNIDINTLKLLSLEVY